MSIVYATVTTLDVMIAAQWATSTHSGGEVTSGISTAPGGAHPEFRGYIVTKIGHVYKLTTTIQRNSGTPIRMYANGVMFASGYTDTYTHIWKATDTLTTWQLLCLSSASCNFSTSFTSVYELVPGCVDPFVLACDGCYKTSTADIWRQPPHATYTKVGK